MHIAEEILLYACVQYCILFYQIKTNQSRSIMSSSKPTLGDATGVLFLLLLLVLRTRTFAGGVAFARGGPGVFLLAALFNVLARAVNRAVAFFKAVSTSMVCLIVSMCAQVV
jgi:hypothetical protein